MQNLYNLAYREEEREMLPLCRSERIAVTPWGPLAAGMLARPSASSGGQTLRGRTDEFARELYQADVNHDVIVHCEQLAHTRGAAPAQIALAWLLHKPDVTAPVIGVTRKEHLIDAVRALDVTLTPDEIGYLEEPYRPHPIVGHT